MRTSKENVFGRPIRPPSSLSSFYTVGFVGVSRNLPFLPSILDLSLASLWFEVSNSKSSWVELGIRMNHSWVHHVQQLTFISVTFTKLNCFKSFIVLSYIYRWHLGVSRYIRLRDFLGYDIFSICLPRLTSCEVKNKVQSRLEWYTITTIKVEGKKITRGFNSVRFTWGNLKRIKQNPRCWIQESAKLNKWSRYMTS